MKRGSIFQSTTDTEVVIHLMATSSYHAVEDRMIDALGQIQGAYSMVALTNDTVFGVRDPLGIRPWSSAPSTMPPSSRRRPAPSTSSARSSSRDVRPGELVIVDAEGLHSVSLFPPARRRFCVFEYIYFARPDSVVEGAGVYEVRKRIGAELAREAPVAADIVVPVPDLRHARRHGVRLRGRYPVRSRIVRNHYVGRTFIEPTDRIRHLGVRLKHNANRASIAGRRIVLVDDSIVRGTTSTKIVEMMREAGAAEVHMRIASPPIVNPCYYGVDTPEKAELLASRLGVEEIAADIGVDSLAYLSIDGLYRATAGANRDDDAPQFCDACLSGDYPTGLTDQEGGDAPAQLAAAHGTGVDRPTSERRGHSRFPRFGSWNRVPCAPAFLRSALSHVGVPPLSQA